MIRFRKEEKAMKNNTSRILIETIIRKTLNDIRESPERSIRNLVDMGLHFANGRFQHSFLEMTQTMLQTPNSSYYKLISDMAYHVDPERILRFGMNVGYNGFTIGAKKIREIEKKELYNIPWIISLHLSPNFFAGNIQKYQSLISQGENMGIYTWMLFPDSQPQIFLPLIGKHPDSAFILFCNPEDITSSFLNDIFEYTNLMLAIQYKESASVACGLLRKANLLYSVYYCYHAADLNSIIGGELFSKTQQLHPIFTVLLSAPECSDTIKNQVYHSVRQTRTLQKFHTIIWEIFYDSNSIDGIISNDSCFASFSSQGNLMYLPVSKTEKPLTFFHNDLSYILRAAFPKQKKDFS